jgi:DNA (cytosine-5)-methyltransferase 1
MSRTGRPEESGQFALPFRAEAGERLAVLDLFAGTGGLSLGFVATGFCVTGVDTEPTSARLFEANEIGELVLADLHRERILRDVPVVVGGPPCRPWSIVNMQRRGSTHEDHVLIEHFFAHLHAIRPQAFLMENVPPLRSDPIYHRLTADLRRRGYSIDAQVLQYSDFGTATTRKRLFTVGFLDSLPWAASEFFRRLHRLRRPASTVRDAIGWLAGRPRDSVPDHQWSDGRTIGDPRYIERYRTGKYGWKRLAWDAPAPSFGSVSKTYILHPDSDPERPDPRVLSVREVLSIMGFARSFRFPERTPLSLRYRMAANAVSPVVSANCATVLREMIWGGSGGSHPIVR